MSRELFAISGVVEQVTERAVRVQYEGKSYWFPRSELMIEDGDDDDTWVEEEEVEFSIAYWLAEEKELV